MVVSVVNVFKGNFGGVKRLDHSIVQHVSAFLFHSGGHDNPIRLRQNRGMSYQGSIVLGMGFTFDDTDKKGVATPVAKMRRIITEHPESRK